MNLLKTIRRKISGSILEDANMFDFRVDPMVPSVYRIKQLMNFNGSLWCFERDYDNSNIICFKSEKQVNTQPRNISCGPLPLGYYFNTKEEVANIVKKIFHLHETESDIEAVYEESLGCMEECKPHIFLAKYSNGNYCLMKLTLNIERTITCESGFLSKFFVKLYSLKSPTVIREHLSDYMSNFNFNVNPHEDSMTVKLGEDVCEEVDCGGVYLYSRSKNEYDVWGNMHRTLDSRKHASEIIKSFGILPEDIYFHRGKCEEHIFVTGMPMFDFSRESAERGQNLWTVNVLVPYTFFGGSTL